MKIRLIMGLFGMLAVVSLTGAQQGYSFQTLLSAVDRCYLGGVKRAVRHGVDINESAELLVTIVEKHSQAFERGNNVEKRVFEDMLEFLVDSGVQLDVYHCGYPLVLYACARRNLPMVEVLDECGAGATHLSPSAEMLQVEVKKDANGKPYNHASFKNWIEPVFKQAKEEKRARAENIDPRLEEGVIAMVTEAELFFNAHYVVVDGQVVRKS